MTIGGLRPNLHYKVQVTFDHAFTADQTSRAIIHIALPGRHELHVTREI